MLAMASSSGREVLARSSLLLGRRSLSLARVASPGMCLPRAGASFPRKHAGIPGRAGGWLSTDEGRGTGRARWMSAGANEGVSKGTVDVDDSASVAVGPGGSIGLHINDDAQEGGGAEPAEEMQRDRPSVEPGHEEQSAGGSNQGAAVASGSGERGRADRPPRKWLSPIEWEKEKESKVIFQKLRALRGRQQREYFDEVCRAGKANVFHCNAVMSGSTSISQGEELLDRMKALEISPDVVTYTNLLSIAVRERRMDVAERMIEQMVESGLKPGTHAFSSLIDGYGKMGKLPQALEAFDRMLKNDLVPNEYTYTTLIDLCSKNGDVRRAEHYFNEVLEHKHGLQPTEMVFTAMIWAYSRSEQLQRLQHLLEIMDDVPTVKPDTRLYNAALSGLDKIGEFEDVINLQNLMKEKGIPMNMVAYSTLIDAYGKRGRVKEAERLFHEMVSLGHEPDAIAYCTIIDVLGKVANFDGAIKYFKEMKEKGLKLQDAGAAIIDAFCRNGKLSQAESLLAELRASPNEIDHPSIVCYTALIAGYANIGKPKTAITLNKEVAGAGLATDEGYYMVYLQALNSAKEWARAREAFQEAVDENYEPFCSCVTEGRDIIKLDVHGMSPAAAGTAVDWALRARWKKKKTLVIVTGKEKTYTYDFNTLRAQVESVLLDCHVVWSVRDGAMFSRGKLKDEELAIKGGRLVVTSLEWHKFRRRAKLGTKKEDESKAVAGDLDQFLDDELDR